MTTGRPEERYKTFHFDKLPEDEVPKDAPAAKRYGLYGVASPDGYRWTKNPSPWCGYFCDTWNIAAWDSLLGSYVGYFRTHDNDNRHLNGGAISRAETSDFGTGLTHDCFSALSFGRAGRWTTTRMATPVIRTTLRCACFLWPCIIAIRMPSTCVQP